jgi:hypothetical protein
MRVRLALCSISLLLFSCAALDIRTINDDELGKVMRDAREAYESQNYPKAKKLLKRVLEIKPNFVEVYYRLGIIAFYENELIEARDYFEKVVAAHPRHSKAQYNLAVVNLALAEQHLNFYTANVDETTDLTEVLNMLEQIDQFSGRGRDLEPHQELDNLAKLLPASDVSTVVDVGKMEYRWTDGRTYMGQVKDGQKQGHGTMEWPNGARYEGDYQGDKKHGEGVFIWPDQHRYVGEFRVDKMHGEGIYSTPDGFKYMGSFYEDLFHGKGQCSFGDTVIDCIFEHGHPVVQVKQN